MILFIAMLKPYLVVSQLLGSTQPQCWNNNVPSLILKNKCPWPGKLGYLILMSLSKRQDKGLIGVFMFLHVRMGFPLNLTFSVHSSYSIKHNTLIMKQMYFIVSWAYIQQSPTCTRNNNLVILAQHPMALRCCSWYRLCPRICNFRSVCIFISWRITSPLDLNDPRGLNVWFCGKTSVF